MSADTDLILRNLPYLRRYARALTGSQRRGDDYVAACLETMLQEPGRVESGMSKRDVFHLFHQVWSALRSGLDMGDDLENGDDTRHRVAHGLAALPAVERMVLLLTALEDFSASETAFILSLSEEEVQDALKEARNDVLLQASVDVLIIEDEPAIAMELTRIVEELGHKVCGIAAREQEAMALALKNRPALVLADIQLKDGESGITAIRNILTEFEMPVIFVTGYPERLLTGDDLEPAFVISKPFVPDSLQIAIGQALTVAPANRHNPPSSASASA